MKIKTMTLCIVLAGQTGFTQTVHFHFVDGSQENFEIADVRKATFSGANMLLHTNEGTVYTWNRATIDFYRYNEVVTSEGRTFVSELPQINVFPNPTSGKVTIQYTLNEDTSIQLEILDLQGKIVFKIDLGVQTHGTHSTSWDGNEISGMHVSSGSYFCQIVMPKMRVSRKFVVF